jgi:hypothetical protein
MESETAHPMLFAAKAPIERNRSMRRLVASLVAGAFAFAIGLALLSAPTAAVGKPGNSCNPPAGHGRSGCHRAAASSSTAGAKAKAAAAARKRAAAQAAAAAKAAAAKRAADAQAAAAAQAAASVQGAPAIAATAPAEAQPVPALATPATPQAPAPVPWWIALWRLLVG